MWRWTVRSAAVYVWTSSVRVCSFVDVRWLFEDPRRFSDAALIAGWLSHARRSGRAFFVKIKKLREAVWLRLRGLGQRLRTHLDVAYEVKHVLPCGVQQNPACP